MPDRTVALVTSITKAASVPTPSDENLLINELIREYFQFNSYRESLSVMIPGESLQQNTCTPHTA